MKHFFSLLFTVLAVISCRKDPPIKIDEPAPLTENTVNIYKLEGNFSGNQTIISERWEYSGVIIHYYPWDTSGWDYSYNSSIYVAQADVEVLDSSEIDIEAAALPPVYPTFSETFAMDTLIYSGSNYTGGNFEVQFIGETGDSLYIHAVFIHEDIWEDMMTCTAVYKYNRFETQFALKKI